MNIKGIEVYEEKYKTNCEDALVVCQKIRDDSWKAAIEQAISVVESYRVSVGNSPSGELAAEWTMKNLREVRDELRGLIHNKPISAKESVGSRITHGIVSAVPEDYDMALEDIPDTELPGMWERADFTGGP